MPVFIMHQEINNAKVLNKTALELFYFFVSAKDMNHKNVEHK